MDSREAEEAIVRTLSVDSRKWLRGVLEPFVLAFLAYVFVVLTYDSAAEMFDKSRLLSARGRFLLTVSALPVVLIYGVLDRTLGPFLSRSLNTYRFLRAEFIVGSIYTVLLLLVVWVFGVELKTVVVIYGGVLTGLGVVYRLESVDAWIGSAVKPRVARLARGLYERLSKSLLIGFMIAFLASAVADYSIQPVWAELLSEVAFLMLVSCAVIEIARALRNAKAHREPDP